MRDRIRQAYKQKPWRTQLQWVGRILLGLIIFILGTILHLNITTQAAAAGVDIRVLERDRENLERNIDNNRTELAIITSAAVMQERAKELGFQHATKDDIEYIFIDEYIEKEPDIITSQSVLNRSQQTAMNPKYTQSIWDTLFSGTLYGLERGGK